MKNAFKFRISVILLFILMTIGYILLAFCYTGPRYVVLIVFIVLGILVRALSLFFHQLSEFSGTGTRF